MSYSSRIYRQRNAHTHDDSKKEGNVSGKHDTEQEKKHVGDSKQGITVNEPGDSYEKEADIMARNVVSNETLSAGVSQKAPGSVQRLSTSAEEDKFSTNDARMKKDKDVQRAVDPKKEEDTVQKKSETKKDEEKVQKKEEPKKEEEKIQKKDEFSKDDEKLQKTADPEKEKHKK
jgi:hypothetical protein